MSKQFLVGDLLPKGFHLRSRGDSHLDSVNGRKSERKTVGDTNCRPNTRASRLSPT
ncbi:MAG: hypothetical protein LBF88_01525 [Planctomycetaceae bacterium]|nr:hypothetical protein [Planctomycetaceae bacterium]